MKKTNEARKEFERLVLQFSEFKTAKHRENFVDDIHEFINLDNPKDKFELEGAERFVCWAADL